MYFLLCVMMNTLRATALPVILNSLWTGNYTLQVATVSQALSHLASLLTIARVDAWRLPLSLLPYEVHGWRWTGGGLQTKKSCQE